MDTLKACINVGPHWKNSLETAFSGRRLARLLPSNYKGIEGSEWDELRYHFRKMSKAAGARKPCESQKAKDLWAMKAAKDRGDDFYYAARKYNILGRNQTRLEQWEEHLKDPMIALDKALKCLEDQYQG